MIKIFAIIFSYICMIVTCLVIFGLCKSAGYESRRREEEELREAFKEVYNQMRDASLEEQESVSNYIKSISVDTGVKFYDDEGS